MKILPIIIIIYPSHDRVCAHWLCHHHPPFCHLETSGGTANDRWGALATTAVRCVLPTAPGLPKGRQLPVRAVEPSTVAPSTSAPAPSSAGLPAHPAALLQPCGAVQGIALSTSLEHLQHAADHAATKGAHHPPYHGVPLVPAHSPTTLQPWPGSAVQCGVHCFSPRHLHPPQPPGSSAPALRDSTGHCTVHLSRAPAAAAACEPMDACTLLQQPCTFSIETCLPTHQKLLATRPAGLPTSNLQTDLHDAGPTDKPHFKFPFQISQFPSRWQ